MKITIVQTAKLIGKSPEYVRYGLRSGELGFGSAVGMPSGKYSYHVSENKLADYMGMTIEQMLEVLYE